MKRMVWLIAILVLACSVNAFGQNQRKKKHYNNLPEVNDEVLVAFRKKNPKYKVIHHTKSTKRKRTILQFDEADAIFGKTKKYKKIRRKNK